MRLYFNERESIRIEEVPGESRVVLPNMWGGRREFIKGRETESTGVRERHISQTVGAIDRLRRTLCENAYTEVTTDNLTQVLEGYRIFCPSCGEDMTTVSYVCQQMVYGTADVTVMGDTDNHEMQDTGDQTDYAYECENCGSRVSFPLAVTIPTEIWNIWVPFLKDLFDADHPNIMGAVIEWLDERPIEQPRGLPTGTTRRNYTALEGMPIDELESEDVDELTEESLTHS
jgi:predicted RNA-binding Zn-ribbon protein involved in translation (DUF1610 family)